MKKVKPKIHDSGDNIFSDLEFPEAGSHFLGAQIVAELYRLSKARKLSQSRAGQLMGISQPEISRLFSGHFREYSIERLMNFLTAFDRDVEIVVRPLKGQRRGGQISFTSKAA